jgi:hypothetical protein
VCGTLDSTSESVCRVDLDPARVQAVAMSDDNDVPHATIDDARKNFYLNGSVGLCSQASIPIFGGLTI